MPTYRKHGRALVKCAVKFSHEKFGEFFAETRDISETGVFVCSKNIPRSICVGDLLAAEMKSSQSDIKLENLIVVRLTDEGVGLSYY